jgi:site-specific recombinase XerD
MGERDGSHPTPGLLELLRQELKLMNYSYKTVSVYSSCLMGPVRNFAPRHPRELSSTDIRNYLLHLIKDDGIAPSTVNQVLNALRFLYVELYKVPFVLGPVPLPKRPKKLPVVLSLEEVRRISKVVRNQKHLCF